MVGVEGEGKVKNRAREERDDPNIPRSIWPFPPILRPATQANTQLQTALLILAILEYLTYLTYLYFADT